MEIALKNIEILFIKIKIINTYMSDDDKQLNSNWKVWMHGNGSDWSLESYIFLYEITNINSFWKFFNSFTALNKTDNQFYIMRNEITPIWEDVNNRNGSICSLLIGFQDINTINEITSEIMMVICLLILNETFIKNNNIINGISYNLKNRTALIKIWIVNNTIIQPLLPKNIINKIESTLKSLEVSRGSRKFEKILIRELPIIPQF